MAVLINGERSDSEVDVVGSESEEDANSPQKTSGEDKSDSSEEEVEVEVYISNVIFHLRVSIHFLKAFKITYLWKYI